MLIRTVTAFTILYILALGYALHSAPAALSAPVLQVTPGVQATRGGLTTTVTPATVPSERTYVVLAGDNPWVIAQKVYGNGTKYPLILNANHLTESSRLAIGMVLVIPPLPGTFATPSVPVTATSAVAITVTVQAGTLPLSTPTLTQVPTTATRTEGPPRTSTLTPTATPVPSIMMIWVRASATPDLVKVLDLLGWACTLGSLVCSFLAYQGYHRARRLRRMMIMSRRARARL